MYFLVILLAVIASILMCCIVLIQESKGGGLAADYSSNNQILGAPKTTNFVEKATWYLAAAMIVLSVMSVAFLPKVKTVGSNVTVQQAADMEGAGEASDAAATAETEAAQQ